MGPAVCISRSRTGELDTEEIPEEGDEDEDGDFEFDFLDGLGVWTQSGIVCWLFLPLKLTCFRLSFVVVVVEWW